MSDESVQERRETGGNSRQFVDSSEGLTQLWFRLNSQDLGSNPWGLGLFLNDVKEWSGPIGHQVTF